MGKTRRTFSNEMKAKVSLEALQAQKKVPQISQEFYIHFFLLFFDSKCFYGMQLTLSIIKYLR